MSLALFKIQQHDISCKRTISKNLVGVSQKNNSGKGIKFEENETSLEEIIPFLYHFLSAILQYRKFSKTENVWKNLYPEKKNVNLFSVNYSNLREIPILL